MEKAKVPVVMVASTFAVGFFDGMFGWGLSDDLYMVVGIAALVGIIWLLRLTFKK